jgi:opacity protein-like surface antigen
MNANRAKRINCAAVFMLLIMISSSSLVFAEEGKRISSEIAGFAGVAAGRGISGIAYGGSFALGATPRMLVIGEFTCVRAGGQSGNVIGYDYESGGKGYEFNGGLHYQIPIANPKIVPYIAAGLGMLRVTENVNMAGYSSNFRDNNAAVNFGAGMRYNISNKWGIRPELKVFISSATYMRFGISVFHQTR